MSAMPRSRSIGTRLSFAIGRGSRCARHDISCELGCSFDEVKTGSVTTSPEVDYDALFMQLEDGLFGTAQAKQQSPGSFFPRSRNKIERSDSESSQSPSHSQSSTRSTVSSVQEYIWSNDGDAMVPDAPLGE